MRRSLTPAERHQLRIARQTLTMADAILAVLGGLSKAEAAATIARLEGRELR